MKFTHTLPTWPSKTYAHRCIILGKIGCENAHTFLRWDTHNNGAHCSPVWKTCSYKCALTVLFRVFKKWHPSCSAARAGEPPGALRLSPTEGRRGGSPASCCCSEATAIIFLLGSQGTAVSACILTAETLPLKGQNLFFERETEKHSHLTRHF